jgi:hypothetical protein
MENKSPFKTRSIQRDALDMMNPAVAFTELSIKEAFYFRPFRIAFPNSRFIKQAFKK